MKKIVYALLVITSLILTACSNNSDKTSDDKQQTTAKKQETVATKSSDITLKDTDGNIITVSKTKKGYTFSNAKGKVVLVSFFATWCPPCKAEIPHLNNLQEKYKDKISIIGILLEENKDNDEIKKFINYNAINYIISNSVGNQKLATAVGGVSNIPFMIMYGKDGSYVTNYLGAVPEEMIDSDIESALKK
jgi:thiol-disulfide isomerase/thioredoxin